MKALLIAAGLFATSGLVLAAEKAGVSVDDEIKTATGQTLILNGQGLREKLWIDVYVGSLYLPARSSDVAEILSRPGPWRVQLDFIYKEVSREQILEGWREGFEKNQSVATLEKLRPRIEQFNAYFGESAIAGDRYVFEYAPTIGTRVNKNGQPIGVIPGEDFANALLEIWLGNKPADKGLKRGMLGL